MWSYLKLEAFEMLSTALDMGHVLALRLYRLNLHLGMLLLIVHTSIASSTYCNFGSLAISQEPTACECKHLHERAFVVSTSATALRIVDMSEPSRSSSWKPNWNNYPKIPRTPSGSGVGVQMPRETR